MSQIQQQLKSDLIIRGYSPETRRVYLRHVRNFEQYVGRSAADMGRDEVRRFLMHLIQECNACPETVRQARAALAFLYRHTVGKPMVVESVPVPRKKKRLPSVFSGTEVEALFAAVRSPKYRAVLMAMYAGGLRISEACELRTVDIHSDRMLLHVLGKGDKDRFTLLSRRLLQELRAYYRAERPAGQWLFPGHSKTGHISVTAVRNTFHKAAAAAGIRRRVTPHMLRHSFATHLIDLGTDVTVVSKALGHKSLRTTQVYTHVSVRHLARTVSPLDMLATARGRYLG